MEHSPYGKRSTRPGGGAWRIVVYSLAAGLLGVACDVCTAAATLGYRGLSLEQALRRLEVDGLRLMFSSELVRPEMLVRREPLKSEPREVLAELIEPHGLKIDEGPGSLLLLVRDTNVAASQGRIVGLLRRMPDGAPVAGAIVRIAAAGRQILTDERGRFEFRDLNTGEYALELSDANLKTTDSHITQVRARETTVVRVDAIPQTGIDIAEVTVTASRYALSDVTAPPVITLVATDLQRLPEFADDPLRSLARLPGLAGSDFSAKFNSRGGANDETLLRFDGLRLVNPFHMKDFLSPFSALNPSVLGDINVYTGGFPAEFGDRMSGVVDITSKPPADQGIREVSLSFFNASLLVSGPAGGHAGDNWLIAGRRGNLDLITRTLDARLGRPSYRDLYARVRRTMSDEFALTGSALLLDDDIELSDSDAEELAQARYTDTYLWLKGEYTPREHLRTDFVLAHGRLRSDRSGSADQPGVGRGVVNDQRVFDITTLQGDGSWRSSEALLWKFGGEWRYSRGRYDYRDQTEFDLLFATPGASTESVRDRVLSVVPRSNYLGAYTTLRLETNQKLATEVGLRIDAEDTRQRRSTYLSPRLALLYPLTDRLQVRASWGRFVQTRGIDELPVSDGIVESAPPQRAEHSVASLEYRHRSGLDLRLEAYRKNYSDLSPRHENLLNTFVLLPELKPDRVRIAPDRAVAQGFELSVRRSESRELDWWISYGQAEVRDYFSATDISGSINSPRSWDQLHHASVGIAWRTDRWEASIAGLFHSGWPTTDIRLREDPELAAGDPATVDVGPVNAKRLRNYSSLDARIARNFRFAPDNHLMVFLEVTNVFGTRNECCVEFQIDDEADIPLLDLQRVRARPLVPSIGLAWKF